MHVGSEPANLQRGYEFWVAKEAKARNTRALIYGLPWEWPAWVGNGLGGTQGSPWVNTSNAVRYTMEWIKGAQRVHNLHTDFVGLWNERPYDSGYVLALRAALDASGFASTHIVGPDGSETAAQFWNETQTNPAFAAAVHAIGFHYPNSDPSAKVPGISADGSIALWASEDDSTVSPPHEDSEMASPHPREQPGGGCLVRTINENFVQGGLTATIVWNLIMARYPQMRWDYTGLVAAIDPFGGHYDVLPAVWAAAHTTQFAQPGFKILPVGHGSGYLKHGGTFVSYAGPAGEFTIVVEKMDVNKSRCERGERNVAQQQVTAAERATFAVNFPAASRLSPRSLSVWKSNFGVAPYSAGGEHLFQQAQDVPVVDGHVSIELLPNWAYTLTTIITGNKGVTTPPLAGQFPLTYTDNFERCNLSHIPKYVAPMSGSFDCVDSSRGGRAVRQVAPSMAICDRGDVMPYAVLGDGFRTTYNISIDFLLPPSDEDRKLAATGREEEGVFVGARAKGPVGALTAMSGVFLAVNSTGYRVALSIGNLTTSRNHASTGSDSGALLLEGSLPELGHGLWRRVSLAVEGTTARATVDSKLLFESLSVPSPHEHYTSIVAKHIVPLGRGGYASFGTVGYTAAEFDNLYVKSS